MPSATEHSYVDPKSNVGFTRSPGSLHKHHAPASQTSAKPCERTDHAFDNLQYPCHRQLASKANAKRPISSSPTPPVMTSTQLIEHPNEHLRTHSIKYCMGARQPPPSQPIHSPWIPSGPIQPCLPAVGPHKHKCKYNNTSDIALLTWTIGLSTRVRSCVAAILKFITSPEPKVDINGPARCFIATTDPG